MLIEKVFQPITRGENQDWVEHVVDSGSCVVAYSSSYGHILTTYDNVCINVVQFSGT